MATAATKKTPAPDESAATAALADAPTPEVQPVHVTVDPGQFARRVLVRMPAGTVADDLRNPKIWRKIQCVRQKALLKLDELLVLGHDESWAAQAIVTYATNTAAHLAILKVFGFKAVGEGLYTDGKYEVFWDGGSYSVRRCEDKVIAIPSGFASEGMAIEALRSLYPKVVA